MSADFLAPCSAAMGYACYMGTGFSWRLAIIHFVPDLIICIIPSHLYRNFSRRRGWHTLSLPNLPIGLVPVLIVMGFVFMILTIAKTVT